MPQEREQKTTRSFNFFKLDFFVSYVQDFAKIWDFSK